MADDRRKVVEATVLRWISEGRTLQSLIRKPTPDVAEALGMEAEALAVIGEKMPGRSTIYDWLEEDDDFAGRFARARVMWRDAMLEQAVDIANEPEVGETVETWISGEGESEKSSTTTRSGDMIHHRKLKVWARMQLVDRCDIGHYARRGESDVDLWREASATMPGPG